MKPKGFVQPNVCERIINSFLNRELVLTVKCKQCRNQHIFFTQRLWCEYVCYLL